jgi:dienelactone hydrolase
MAFRASFPVLVACALLAAACSGGDDQAAPPPPAAPPTTRESVFDYDRDAPLVTADGGRVNRNYPIQVRDVSFASRGRRVRAFLVVPPGKGPFPGVIYAHGSGQDRLAFVAQATWIAARGAVAITVDQPSDFAPDPAGDALTGLREQRDRTARSVVDFRRSVDLLQSLQQVDDERIGFVGFSAGARIGAILAGVERRIDAFALMSGGATPISEYVEPLQPSLRAQALALLGAVDPLQHVARAAPAALLFQNGRRDDIVPQEALQALAGAGSRPKRIEWYPAGHGLNVRAYRDQLDWLATELEIKGPPVRGAIAGP